MPRSIYARDAGKAKHLNWGRENPIDTGSFEEGVIIGRSRESYKVTRIRGEDAPDSALKAGRLLGLRP